MRPLLILGPRGTLGRAFARVCDARGIAYYLAGRGQIDLTRPFALEGLLDETNAWAVVKAAGYVRVDAAESEPDVAMAVNASGLGWWLRSVRVVLFRSSASPPTWSSTDKDMLTAFWKAIQRPGGAVGRGPRRWYVEVHPQEISGFLELVTHPWVTSFVLAWTIRAAAEWPASRRRLRVSTARSLESERSPCVTSGARTRCAARRA